MKSSLIILSIFAWTWSALAGNIIDERLIKVGGCELHKTKNFAADVDRYSLKYTTMVTSLVLEGEKVDAKNIAKAVIVGRAIDKGGWEAKPEEHEIVFHPKTGGGSSLESCLKIKAILDEQKNMQERSQLQDCNGHVDSSSRDKVKAHVLDTIPDREHPFMDNKTISK